MSTEENNKERFRDLEKAVKELETEDILRLAVSVKALEVEMRNLVATCKEMKSDHESVEGLVLEHDREIGKVKGWFVPIGAMWVLMLALITWALNKK